MFELSQFLTVLFASEGVGLTVKSAMLTASKAVWCVRTSAHLAQLVHIATKHQWQAYATSRNCHNTRYVIVTGVSQ